MNSHDASKLGNTQSLKDARQEEAPKRSLCSHCRVHIQLPNLEAPKAKVLPSGLAPGSFALSKRNNGFLSFSYSSFAELQCWLHGIA